MTTDARKVVTTTLETILLRVGAMQFSTLELFQCPAVLRQARLAEGAQQRTQARRQARCDALHVLIPAHTGPTRRALLELKRAVHNDRRSPTPLNAPFLRACLKPEEALRQDLGEWEADLETQRQSIERGAEALREDWGLVQQNLISVWSDDMLARGVLHAQPELYRNVDKMTRDPEVLRKPAKQRNRRWEFSLLAYVYRATTKTSPFSTLTLTAVGRAANDATVFAVPRPTELSSHLGISPEIVSAVARRWLSKREVAALAPMRCPEVVEVNGDRIVYLRADHSLANERDNEAIRTISDAPIAQVVLHLLRAEGPLVLGVLKRRLAETLGCDGEAMTSVLRQLQDTGLLRPAVGYEPCRPDALKVLVNATSALGASSVDIALRSAETVVERLGALAGRPAHEQAVGLQTVREDLRGLVDDKVDRYGSAIFDRCWFSRIVDIPATAIDWVAPTLRRLLRVMPLFNVEHGADRVVQQFFRERCAHGRVVPVLEGFAQLQEELDARFHGSERDSFSRACEESDASSAVTSCRQSMLHEVRDLLGHSRGAPVALTDEFLCRWADRAGAFDPRRTRLSASFLGQMVETWDDSGPDFALNGVVSGYGTLAAAWARTEPSNEAGAYLRERLIERLRALDPKGDVVEIATALGFGGQMRERLTDLSLPYPGSALPSQPERQLDWADLGLALIQPIDRVSLVRRQDLRRVLPLHLGTLSSIHFPPFYRFVMALGPAFTPTFSLIDLIEAELPDSDRAVPRQYRRITAGPVVLSRATWCLPADTFPRFDEGPLSFAGFLALRSWARDFDLPQRVFLTGALTSDLVRDSVNLHALKRARKPFYLDFDDYTSCALACRFTRRLGPTVHVSEMLPLPEENPFRHDDQARTIECVLEIQGDDDSQ